MRIPGFAGEPSAHGMNTGDLLRPQFFTCEEELAPVCRNRCRGAYNYPVCVRRCLAKACKAKW
ncbi:hypothetical protein ACFXGT_38335 [Streptomyces sp. NPDC059352]|uniref:hypothetical protein n=1 Tax=Streptomyces sp. NPDC059352 TaxID=3346810 RepID=UPI0036B35735